MMTDQARARLIVTSPKDYLPQLQLMWKSGINFRDPDAREKYMQWLRGNTSLTPEQLKENLRPWEAFEARRRAIP